MGWIHEWGSTPDERSESYPCDRFVEEPSGACFRAIDIQAPVPIVFSWLCQLREAPYSYDWIDNYARQSPRVRNSANERLAIGQTVMRVFKLADYRKDDHITLVVAGTRMFGRLAVTYRIKPTKNGARLIVKLTYQLSVFSPMKWLLPVGDLFMMRKQLMTLKNLAEKEALG